MDLWVRFFFSPKCILQNFHQLRTKIDVMPFLQEAQTVRLCSLPRPQSKSGSIRKPACQCQTQCSQSTRRHHLQCGTINWLIFLVEPHAIALRFYLQNFLFPKWSCHFDMNYLFSLCTLFLVQCFQVHCHWRKLVGIQDYLCHSIWSGEAHLKF